MRLSRVAFLLVTCCLEPTRAEILGKVIQNLQVQAPGLKDDLVIFDNASTAVDVVELRRLYRLVYRANKNVGYWTAIDWWLDSMKADPPDYTYIIESDMIHYSFYRLGDCARYLDTHPDVGSVRLHEYSVANRHLYNKDKPVPGGRPAAWQSHTNKVNGKPVFISDPENDIWRTSFLTQLPALNRYETMLAAFTDLRTRDRFTEIDFQRLYWDRYQVTGILDGGIFNSDLGADVEKNAAIGSWTSPEALKRMGYQATRVASITPADQYTVSRL